MTAEWSIYAGSSENKKFADARIIFNDTETSNWAWDPTRQAYYWHRFFSHQPDLNFDNPAVHDALFKALWADGLNMADPDVIGQVLAVAGLDALVMDVKVGAGAFLPLAAVPTAIGLVVFGVSRWRGRRIRTFSCPTSCRRNARPPMHCARL